MIKKPRILILEDNASDADLALSELRKAELVLEAKRVEGEGAFLKALKEFRPEVIIADYSLPQFNGLDALHLLKDLNLSIPFILCSGTLTEEIAAECMKQGAADYILKSNLKRLPSALINTLEKTEARMAKEKAIAALRESEEKFRSIVETTNEWIWSADLQWRLTYSNPAIEKILGYHPEEILGKGLLELMLAADRQNIEKEFHNFVVNKQGWSGVVCRWQHKDGSYRYLESNGVPIFDASGEMVGCRGADRDITERKLAERALIKSEELLQQSQKMEAIGTLTGGVAHDFNNLLMTILGNTQLALRKIKPEDPLRVRLTEIEKAGNRAVELTRKLLAFSRRQHLERQTTNLNENIAEIMKLLERIIGEDIEITANYADDLSPVFADPGQIEQVIMNLSLNARDAMPHGGQLAIETNNVKLDENYCRRYPYVKPGNFVRIKVSDSGTGMDEETKAHIFEPFFTTKPTGKGTGLGLSMAYGIVKQHDGHIHVHSEVGRGTTFEIYFPVDTRVVEKETKTALSPSAGGTETILIAEDEESLRILAKGILEELGYTVLQAKNGEEALETFARNRERVNLLLFDVVMPRMGGLEAYEHIRALKADIPLILMTGYSRETVQSPFVRPERSAEELGAVVIQKPYDIDGLGHKVREVLNGFQRTVNS